MVFKILNRVSANLFRINIYSDIGGWGFSAKDLATELKGLKAEDTIEVHVNSVGGDVFEGLAIYNTLVMHPGPVITINEGIAASIASVIFLAGKTRKMFDNAFVMIHNPLFTHTSGNADQLTKQVELLRQAEESIRSIYLSRTSVGEDKLKAMLSAETYLSAEEAQGAGFIQEIIVPPSLDARASLPLLVAKLGVPSMEFSKWLADECAALDLDPTKLTAKQTASFQARFDAIKTKPNPSPTPSPSDALIAEQERLADIADVVGSLGGSTVLNKSYLETAGIKARLNSKGEITVQALSIVALKEKWDRNRFELECRRAETPDIGHVGIHVKSSLASMPNAGEALSCRLVRNAGIPANQNHQVSKTIKYGYENWYKPEVLEASDRPEIRDISLLGIYDIVHQRVHGHRFPGRLNTDAFLDQMRQTLFQERMMASGGTGTTSWTALTIFDDAANKMLMGAYNAVPTTWQEWVLVRSVNDFKTSNLYRMHVTGGYQPVGADGRLKHGGFADDKYTHSADTFGKIVGLTRKDLINDDLGAFNAIMTALGSEGARFLEELFYVQLLTQTATLFPTDSSLGNYTNSAMTVDGLTAAELLFANQTYDNAPIYFQGSILLNGTGTSVKANELYTKTSLEVLQTANAKGRPNDNPHVGKFRPVVSAYLNNTAIKRRSVGTIGGSISGQDSDHWYLLCPPSQGQGGVIIGSFLNGRQSPTVASSDMAFDMLGLQWRAYHDAGADNGDPKLGVHSAGG